MASIIRPFAVASPAVYQVPTGGGLTVDWSKSITNGLIGCWVPGVMGGVDIAGSAPTLTYNTNCVSTYSTSDGPSILSTSSSGGDGLTGTATAPFKFGSNGFTIMWRGAILGAPLGSANPTLMGVSYDNAGSAPFFIAFIWYSTGGTAFQWGGNAAGGNFNSSCGFSITNNVVTTLGVTFNVSSTNVIAYQNGVQTATTAQQTAAPNSSATSQIFVGGDLTSQTRSTNNSTNIACYWSRVLSAGEMMLFHSDPYGFIISDEYDLPIMLPPPPPLFTLMPQIVT